MTEEQNRKLLIFINLLSLPLMVLIVMETEYSLYLVPLFYIVTYTSVLLSMYSINYIECKVEEFRNEVH